MNQQNYTKIQIINKTLIYTYNLVFCLVEKLNNTTRKRVHNNEHLRRKYFVVNLHGVYNAITSNPTFVVNAM